MLVMPDYNELMGKEHNSWVTNRRKCDLGSLLGGVRTAGATLNNMNIEVLANTSVRAVAAL